MGLPQSTPLLSVDDYLWFERAMRRAMTIWMA